MQNIYIVYVRQLTPFSVMTLLQRLTLMPVSTRVHSQNYRCLYGVRRYENQLSTMMYASTFIVTKAQLM